MAFLAKLVGGLRKTQQIHDGPQTPLFLKLLSMSHMESNLVTNRKHYSLPLNDTLASHLCNIQQRDSGVHMQRKLTDSGLSVIYPLLLWEEGWPTKSGKDGPRRRAVLIAFLYCLYLQICKKSRPESLGNVSGIAHSGESQFGHQWGVQNEQNTNKTIVAGS